MLNSYCLFFIDISNLADTTMVKNSNVNAPMETSPLCSSASAILEWVTVVHTLIQQLLHYKRYPTVITPFLHYYTITL